MKIKNFEEFRNELNEAVQVSSEVEQKLADTDIDVDSFMAVLEGIQSGEKMFRDRDWRIQFYKHSDGDYIYQHEARKRGKYDSLDEMAMDMIDWLTEKKFKRPDSELFEPNHELRRPSISLPNNLEDAVCQAQSNIAETVRNSLIYLDELFRFDKERRNRRLKDMYEYAKEVNSALVGNFPYLKELDQRLRSEVSAPGLESTNKGLIIYAITQNSRRKGSTGINKIGCYYSSIGWYEDSGVEYVKDIKFNNESQRDTVLSAFKQRCKG